MQIGALVVGLGLVLLGLIFGVWLGEKKSRVALVVVALAATLAYALAFASFEHFQSSSTTLTWIAAPGLLIAAGLAGPSLAPQLWLRIIVSLAVTFLAVGAILYLLFAYACAIGSDCL